MDTCPKCGNHRLAKDGLIGGRQRYHCQTCGFRPTVIHKSNCLTSEQKNLVLGMRKEGLGFRAIGRVFGKSHTPILKLARNSASE
jgi:transposase-like protein